MAWEHLAIDKPHLAYIILGGFTSLFMLCSLFVKEKLYIGEATVASICGIIFGPHAANLFNPLSWGNVDKITLECSRIVLVVQCFAVGVELPKSYMERHWKSVSFLLVPVMTWGWLATSLFIWWMIEPLSWLESLICAACVTATDPVLASSVVGKGKFSKRVPKHLRDLLSAESGCNDGMAFPFIYLSIYLLRYNLNAEEVSFHWIVYTILYECIFGAIYGFIVGYIGRHAIKFAEDKGLIDRESFLVFYFVLALFCAGSGSILGVDDLLVGFSAGVGFSNDGWFTKKTEESHVSNVIDLLLNLAYFVYLGSIVPWDQYNMPELGVVPWRLIIISVFVILFRRIPIMLLLKPIIPDVKNWREALFAGHFGPIGVGAIFAAILARAELETESTEPLSKLPTESQSDDWLIIYLIWPITTFLVISSIIVHGSSIAVFTLGKRINTLSFTLSYTRGPDDGQSWMDRLPRFDTRSRTLSMRKSEDMSVESSRERFPDFSASGLPKNFLSRQREEDYPTHASSRASSVRPSRRRGRDSEGRLGGPISQSAIMPQRKASTESQSGAEASDAQLSVPGNESPDSNVKHVHEHVPTVQAYQEGSKMIIEDEDGNVLDVEDAQSKAESEAKHQVEADDDDPSLGQSRGPIEGEEISKAIEESLGHSSHWNLRQKLGDWRFAPKHKEAPVIALPEGKRGPAYAYQYGDTVIVEDEDGEVIKKYIIPKQERVGAEASEGGLGGQEMTARLHRLGTWVGLGGKEGETDVEAGSGHQGRRGRRAEADDEDDDSRLRFVDSDGRRMSKAEFIKHIQHLEPKARTETVEKSDIPEESKGSTKQHTHRSLGKAPSPNSDETLREGRARVRQEERHRTPPDEVNNDNTLPFSLSDSLARWEPGRETAAQRRRRAASRQNSRTRSSMSPTRPSDEVNLDRIPTSPDVRGNATGPSTLAHRIESHMAEEAETEPERRRRLAALGRSTEESDSDDDGDERQPRTARPTDEQRKPLGIRFAPDVR